MTIVDQNKVQLKLWTSGLLSVLNEQGLTISWVSKVVLMWINIISADSILFQRLCQTQTNSEIEDILWGVKVRQLDKLLDLTMEDDPSSILNSISIDPSLVHLLPPPRRATLSPTSKPVCCFFC